MNADPVAEITPAIQEALDDPELCATLALMGNSQAWVQFVGGVLNAAYPTAADPAELLAELGSATLQNWEPGNFLTVALELGDALSIATWIDRYFEKVLGAGSAYALDVTVENL